MTLGNHCPGRIFGAVLLHRFPSFSSQRVNLYGCRAAASRHLSCSEAGERSVWHLVR